MRRTLSISAFGLVLLLCLVNAVPYSKYGRSCKDIGCRSNEVCVMAEDPCTIYSREQCGRYPTCTRASEGLSCTTMICPSGQYCKTVNGHPTCVNTSPNLEYDSAGVSSVNGHRTNADTNLNHGSSSSNFNPYANANAPPSEPHHDTNYHTSNSANNNGYPAYPSASGNSNGYPPYPVSGNDNRQPSSGTNLGYPPYPTENRMPQPGIYPNYPPSNSYPAYSNNHQQPASQYPNYPYQTHHYNSNSRRYHHNAGISTLSQSSFSFSISSLIFILINKYLS